MTFSKMNSLYMGIYLLRLIWWAFVPNEHSTVLTGTVSDWECKGTPVSYVLKIACCSVVANDMWGRGFSKKGGRLCWLKT